MLFKSDQSMKSPPARKRRVCVDRFWLLVKTENKVPGACIRWFGLESPGQKEEEEEVLDLDA